MLFCTPISLNEVATLRLQTYLLGIVYVDMNQTSMIHAFLVLQNCYYC